jgi:uncharacterized lipoprotein YajG
MKYLAIVAMLALAGCGETYPRAWECSPNTSYATQADLVNHVCVRSGHSGGGTEHDK